MSTNLVDFALVTKAAMTVIRVIDRRCSPSSYRILLGSSSFLGHMAALMTKVPWRRS